MGEVLELRSASLRELPTDLPPASAAEVRLFLRTNAHLVAEEDHRYLMPGVSTLTSGMVETFERELGIKYRTTFADGRSQKILNPVYELPAGPLLDWVAAHGGLQEVTDLHRDSPELDRWAHVMTRAEEVEWIDFHVLDEFVCTYLKTHPTAVYGDAWFFPTERLRRRATVTALPVPTTDFAARHLAAVA